MYLLRGAAKNYAWGSATAIPQFCSTHTVPWPIDEPFAELWFGDHPRGCATAISLADRGLNTSLHDVITANPEGALGSGVMAAFGNCLPYMVKLIAPVKPLSVQVHPRKDEAARGFVAEERMGIDRDAPQRNYRDTNHKPEMLYAIRDFFALNGFRTARRAYEVITGIDDPLIVTLRKELRSGSGNSGMERAVRRLMSADEGIYADSVQNIANQCAHRVATNASPSLRADRAVLELARYNPVDPTVILALLLNPVSLMPGEVLYTPAGTPHVYISGLALEVMAASDNVLRLGATSKHVDRAEAMRVTDFRAAPPVRVAGEVNVGGVRMYYAPIDEFELGVAEVSRGITWPRSGPRVVVCLSGTAIAQSANEEVQLNRGDAVFASDSDGKLRFSGAARVAVVSVP